MKQNERKGGLEFMGVRYNIEEKMREIRNKKMVTPAEKAVLEEILSATAFARNSKRQICSLAEIFISDLSELCGYKEKDKIWKLLKSLHEKKMIVREKTRVKDVECLGLNQDFWGQVLINDMHEQEQKRHLKMVVDNSKKAPTDRPQDTDTSSVDHIRTVGAAQTDRRETDVQPIDIIEEKPLLDSSRLILDSSRGEKNPENGESFTLSSVREREEEAAEAHRKKVIQQVLEAREELKKRSTQ